ncbi:tetratricopeptide repeat protein [Streptomyces mirabilis]
MSHARVAPELSWFWRLLGLYGERAATARELLAAVGAEPPAGLAEEYDLCVINALSGESGDPADQRRLARVEDVLAGLSRPLRQEQFAGRPTASEESFAPSPAGFRATGDRWDLANCLDPLGMFADWRGDHRHALELLDEGLSYVRELAAPEETSDLLRTRATVLLHQEQPVEAREHLSQALTPARTVGLADKVAGAPRGLGDAARLAGDTGHARVRYESALEACAANWFSMGERPCASSSVSAVPRPRRGASTRRVTGPSRRPTSPSGVPEHWNPPSPRRRCRSSPTPPSAPPSR